MGKPTNARSSPNRPDIFGEILQAKENLGKYLKEKCYSEDNQKLSNKYFVKSFSIPKLLSKVSSIEKTR